MNGTLIYILDPMCSWCWGFASTFNSLREKLPAAIEVQYVMGGLAKDSDEPMPEETQNYVQGQWRLVSEKTGAEFNWDFWKKCQPRRSTYPACRAVIAAGLQGRENIPKMIATIQSAYYLEARNPSDLSTLLDLATGLDLNHQTFSDDIQSPEVEALLQQDFQTRRQLHVTSFPTLVLAKTDAVHFIAQGEDSLDNILSRINTIFA